MRKTPKERLPEAPVSKYAAKRAAQQRGTHDGTKSVTAHENWKGVPTHERQRRAFSESPSALGYDRYQRFTNGS